ncbi:arginase family protein [Embleya sp. NBC_00896]|uniref:arginase family protein n=1 Tax=Embleya sp. NBC_00896 TaxID=2975961 RepID=UPI0038646188|nr:arginase family protein [Embleya sp. NBC_00896]
MPDPTVVEIAQWQGSSTPTARRRLPEGAARLAALASPSGHLRALTDDAPGTAHAGVAHADVLAHNLAAARDAVARAGHPVVTVGGDCAVDLAPIEAAVRRHGDRLAVVWFDAHGDLNTPATSPSGAFHGMILRALLGEGPAELSPERALRPGQVVLAGVRALDEGERAYIDRHGIPVLPPARLADPADLVAAVTTTGADAVHIHIDLDVLDPTTFPAVGTPEPNGLPPAHLLTAVAALTTHFTVTGLTITEYESTGTDPAVLTTLIPQLITLTTHTPPTPSGV